MQKTLQMDNRLMSLLKLSVIDRLICDTNLGPLKLRLRKGERNYFLVLDAVELDKETNKEIMEMLFPIPLPSYTESHGGGGSTIPDKKKIGRPKKVKSN